MFAASLSFFPRLQLHGVVCLAAAVVLPSCCAVTGANALSVIQARDMLLVMLQRMMMMMIIMFKCMMLMMLMMLIIMMMLIAATQPSAHGLTLFFSSTTAARGLYRGVKALYCTESRFKQL
jgi:hypothetical protein